METPEVDKIEDALLAALSLLVTMNKRLTGYLDPEEAILATTIRKLDAALKRWREIEAIRQLLHFSELN